MLHILRQVHMHKSVVSNKHQTYERLIRFFICVQSRGMLCVSTIQKWQIANGLILR